MNFGFCAQLFGICILDIVCACLCKVFSNHRTVRAVSGLMTGQNKCGLENNRSFSSNIITDVATTNKLHFREARRKFYLRSTLDQCVKIAFIFLREFLRRHLLWFILVIGFFGDNDFGDIAMLVTDGRCSWQNDYVWDLFFIMGVLNVLNQSITSCHQNVNMWTTYFASNIRHQHWFDRYFH